MVPIYHKCNGRNFNRIRNFIDCTSAFAFLLIVILACDCQAQSVSKLERMRHQRQSNNNAKGNCEAPLSSPHKSLHQPNLPIHINMVVGGGGLSDMDRSNVYFPPSIIIINGHTITIIRIFRFHRPLHKKHKTVGHNCHCHCIINK